MGLFQFFNDDTFKLVKTQRPFFGQSLALVRILRQIVPKDDQITTEGESNIFESLSKQIEELRRVTGTVSNALLSTQNANTPENEVKRGLEGATKCINAYAERYATKIALSRDKIQAILEKAAHDDDGIVNTISTINDKIAQTLEKIKAHFRVIELNLQFYNRITANSPKNMESSIITCKIDSEATLDILSHRLSNQISCIDHRFKFDLTENHHFYAQFPCTREEFQRSSNSNLIYPFDHSITLGSLKRNPLLLHVIGDCGFLIYITQIPPAYRPQFVGNMWHYEEGGTVLKKLSGVLILLENFFIDLHMFRPPNQNESYLEISSPSENGRPWPMRFVPKIASQLETPSTNHDTPTPPAAPSSKTRPPVIELQDESPCLGVPAQITAPLLQPNHVAYKKYPGNSDNTLVNQSPPILDTTGAQVQGVMKKGQPAPPKKGWFSKAVTYVKEKFSNN